VAIAATVAKTAMSKRFKSQISRSLDDADYDATIDQSTPQIPQIHCKTGNHRMITAAKVRSC
jgi:hypothetical protein